MKKVALVFVLAVLVPSLLLAWLAVRSLRDQQFLLERQQSLLDQRTTDTLAQNISDYLAQRQQEFSAQVESMAAAGDARVLASKFDDELRQRWPLADVGFCVTAAGKILSPLPNARPAAQMFRLDNSGFLGNREPVEVYLTANNLNSSVGNLGSQSPLNYSRGQAPQSSLANSYANNFALQTPEPQRQELKPEDKTEVSNAPLSSQSFAGSGGGGGGGGGSASSFGSGQPASSGTIIGTTLANSNPVAQQEFATDGNLNTPAPAANPASQHAAISDGYNGGQANQSGRNAFFIPQQQSPKSTKQSGASASSAPTQSFAASGLFDSRNNRAFSGSSVGASRAPRDEPVVSDVIVNPVVSNSISSVSQPTQELATAKDLPAPAPAPDVASRQASASDEKVVQKDTQSSWQSLNPFSYKAAASRKVTPQSKNYQNLDKSKAEGAADNPQDNLSKVVPAEAEFRQLIGDQADGMLARFLQNKLKLMCWHRLSAQPDLIFGAQLNLDRVVDGLRNLVQTDQALGDEICLAVLDDNARPVVISRGNFQANWKRPFVATEVGDALPHWEVAAYLVNPAQLTQAAHTARLTLGLLVAVLVVAIGIGSLLIVRGLETELKLARQKTDFVSNVSHELKTPLTSIRMFSELLAEGRVTDQGKQRSYLHIITAEAARLTRLINNVLDFSRMESGEKKYNFQPCDLTEIVRAAAETFRPHLEASGFQFACELPAAQIPLRGDADALSQVIVNLLSNAEKYSAQPERRSPTRLDSILSKDDELGQETGAPLKEISLQLARRQSPLPHVEVRVLDRGPGVPRGSEEKIFEKFYRAHDSLSSGIQGSGLGLTIARQIARAHGGDVIYESREGGGSCLILRLPVLTTEEHG